MKSPTLDSQIEWMRNLVSHYESKLRMEIQKAYHNSIQYDIDMSKSILEKLESEKS